MAADLKLWVIGIALSAVPILEKFYHVDSAGNAAADTLNFLDVLAASDEIRHHVKDHEPWQLRELRFKSGPERILKIKDRHVNLDYFMLAGAEYASARLRNAFAADEGVISYRNVDTSPSPQAIQAIGYQTFFVRPLADVFDPDRMPGHVRPVRQEDGSLRDEWTAIFPEGGPNRPSNPIYYRSGFVPPAPMFRARGLEGTIFVTDDLAERVMRAGMTGIGFRDIEGERGERELIYRKPA